MSCSERNWFTVNPEIFAGISFSRIALKDISATLKNRDYGMISYISKRQGDFAIHRGYYFRETSQIKPSRKFPNLQYASCACGGTLTISVCHIFYVLFVASLFPFLYVAMYLTHFCEYISRLAPV